MKRVWWLLVVLLLSVVGAFFVPLKTVRMSICTVTGSSTTESTWLGVTTTTYHKSSLERFVEARHPQLLQHRWVVTAHTSWYLVGKKRHGHGWPGWIYGYHTSILDPYVASLDDQGRLDMYRTLIDDDPVSVENLKARIDEFSENWSG